MMRTLLAVIVLVFSSMGARADIAVEAPWVRGTVEGQQASGAFMVLKSTADAAVVGVSAPLAGIAEIHEMTLEGGVMKMRAMPRLALPAGKAVELKPGGYHVMLMNLKQPLQKGEIVPITLTIETAGRKIEKIEVKAEVRGLTAMPATHEHHH